MKTLHTISAVAEIGFGVLLLCFPSAAATLLIGTPLLDTPAALTLMRLGASGLIALGTACWLARDDSRSPATTGLVAAMLFYNFAAVVVLAYTGLGLHLRGPGLWPAVILHTVMACWCVAGLRRRPGA